MLQEISLIEFRNNLGKYLDKINKTNNNIKIYKKGKPTGVVLNVQLAEQFFAWQEAQRLKEIYFTHKPQFEELGQKFLAKHGADQDLDENQLTEMVANA